MTIKELAPNQAVAVQALGTIEINDGDSVLVGIKCVFSNGNYIPVSETFKLTPNLFELARPGEVVVLKRIQSNTNPATNDNQTARKP